jgi:hypothetical protein
MNPRHTSYPPSLSTITSSSASSVSENENENENERGYDARTEDMIDSFCVATSLHDRSVAKEHVERAKVRTDRTGRDDQDDATSIVCVAINAFLENGEYERARDHENETAVRNVEALDDTYTDTDTGPRWKHESALFSDPLAEARGLREEQDTAFSQSEKEDASKERARKAERERIRTLENTERERQECLKAKKEALVTFYEETSHKNEKEAWFSLAVRCPDGQKFVRNCRASDPIQTLFDAYDVFCGERSNGLASPHVFVSTHPVRQFREGYAQGSLEENGLCRSEALYVE